tara:strand:- start:142 stop:720 length:579 start_codon:yes stop_codon:yes gene_type:complete
VEKLTGRKKISVFISGRGSNLKSLINYSKTKKSLIEIVLVISNNEQAKGLNLASKYKIKNITINAKNKKKFEFSALRILKKSKVDILCLAGFMRILSPTFIKKFSKPILNIHPSLLPKYKGLNTHYKAIKNKDKFSGASVHIVNEKLDSGKVILQKKIKITKKDTPKSLEKKILKIEHQIYKKAIIKFLTSF